MHSGLDSFARRYCATLYRFQARREEHLRLQAYELGRMAIRKGIGVLEIARIHQQALMAWVAPQLSVERRMVALKAAEAFFMEILSPFEAAHRAFREANEALRQLNETLGRRHAELARKNRKLAEEVAERKRMEQALRQSEQHYHLLFSEACLFQEKLRRLSSQMLHVQEEERKRISRELHDQVGQALTAINTNLAILQRGGTKDVALFNKRIADAQQLLRETLEIVHGFARELRPAMLDELGLLPALRSFLRAFAERTGLDVRFYRSADAEKLEPEQKTVLFRVAQESLTNVVKHAQASQVIVTVRRVGRRIQMQIKDNGKAFRANSTLGGKGLGITGMQERVRLIHGLFAIKSVPGRGTVVSAEIPLKGTRGENNK